MQTKYIIAKTNHPLKFKTNRPLLPSIVISRFEHGIVIEIIPSRLGKQKYILVSLCTSVAYTFRHRIRLCQNDILLQIPAPIFGSKNQSGTGRNDIGKVWEENKRSAWIVPTRGFKGAHFATFPPDLIQTCIEEGCPDDGVVLYPFMWAGTTALVTRGLGRNYVGIELNEDYVRLAEDRLQECVRVSKRG